MKNSKIIVVCSAFLICYFLPAIVISQTISKEFNQLECAKPSPKKFVPNKYYFDYVLHEDQVVRREGNHIDYLDENLSLISHLTLPENEDLKDHFFYRYQIVVSESYIYVCQTLKEAVSRATMEIKESKLYRIQKLDFMEIESFEIPHTTDEDQISILEKNDIIYISTKSNRLLKKFYTVDNENLSLSTLAYDNLLHQLPNKIDFRSAFLLNDTITFSATELVNKEITTTTVLVDNALEILSYRKIVNNFKKDLYSVYDINGTQIFQGNTESYNTTFFSDRTDFADIHVDSNTFYIRKLRSVNGGYETWLSTDLDNKKVHIEKKFMDMFEDLDLSGATSCFPLPDPANGSITLRMTFPIYTNSTTPYGNTYNYAQSELCIYLSLTKELELRSIYSTTFIYDPESSFLIVAVEHGGNYNSSVLKEVQNLSYFKNNSKIAEFGQKNAYDVLHTLINEEHDFFTIFHSMDKQYLFVEKEDGTSNGYIFTKK